METPQLPVTTFTCLCTEMFNLPALLRWSRALLLEANPSACSMEIRLSSGQWDTSGSVVQKHLESFFKRQWAHILCPILLARSSIQIPGIWMWSLDLLQLYYKNDAHEMAEELDRTSLNHFTFFKSFQFLIPTGTPLFSHSKTTLLGCV